MARTIAQIENDIDNQLLIHIMEYVKDYMSHKLNAEFGNLNLSLGNIKAHILGMSQVTAQLGQPLAPSTTVPASPNEGDWYFNITDKKFYMYHTGAWQALADLSHIVDTTPIETYEVKDPADPMAEIAAKDTVSFRVQWPDVQLDTSGGASFPGNFVLLDKNGEGVIESSSHQTGNLVKATAAGIEIWRGGSKQRGPYAWNTLQVVVTKIRGKAIVLGGGSANPTFGTLEELYKVENGEPVDKFTEKVLHLGEIAELVKDQRDIDKGFLASFTDELTYTDATHIQYRDKGLDLVTLNAEVSKNGNNLSYTTLIRPYDRISQEQASFEGVMQQDGMTVEYIFTGKGKALKFFGNKNDKYKWETIAKFEGNTRVPYIRFTGSAVMDTADNALSPAPTWTRQTLPYEVKLSDLMDEINRTALVQMLFQTEPQLGDKLLEINYLTSTYFIETRFGKLLSTINANNDARYEFKTFDFTAVDRPLSELVQSGNRYVIIDMPNGAGATPIGANNELQLGAAPTGVLDADQVTYGTELIWIVKANGDIMNWSEIKDHVANHETMVIRHLSSGNWELVGWKSILNKKYVDTALALKTDKTYVDTELDKKLNLGLDNVKSDAEKAAFINGLKAIGVDTSLFGEFQGVLSSAPVSPVDLHWYINSTDDTVYVYHNSAWHSIGATSAPTNTLTKQQLLNLLGVTEAQVDQLKTLITDLADKVDVTDFNTAMNDKLDASIFNTTLQGLNVQIAAKQNILTTEMTIEFTDGSTRVVKVG